MSDEDVLRSVVAAIADETAVNWTAAELAARDPAERALLNQLKTISTVAASDRPRAHTDDRAVASWPAIGYGAILAFAMLKVALAFVGWSLPPGPIRPVALPASPYIINLSVFSVAAVVLLLGGARDERARRLGAFFLIVASAFSSPLLSRLTSYHQLRSLAFVLTDVPIDAFLAFAFWLFVWSFPAAPLRSTDRRMTRFFLRTSLAIGLVLVGANVALTLEGTGFIPPTIAAASSLLDRRSPISAYYWIALFGVLAPAVPYLLWKSRFEAVDERHRATFFAVSLAAGVTPMLLTVILSPFVGFLADPANRTLVGVFVYSCLMAVVPLTAYAVLVHRVMDIQLIVTETMQYSLFRYAVWLVSVAPFVLLVVYVYASRDLTVREIVAKRASVVLLPLPLIGLVLLMFRSQALEVIDRRFLAGPPDYPEVLTRLERALRKAQGVGEIAVALTREVERALHPRSAAVLVNESGGMLVSPTDAVRPLSAQSSLGQLLRHARQEIDVGTHASGSVARLFPAEDRQWLIDTGFQLLAPLVGSTGDFLGALAIGAKRSGLPCSRGDRLLLSSMATHGALILENRYLGNDAFRIVPSAASRGVNWNDEPGALCSRCGSVWPARTAICQCGGSTGPAALPFLSCGKFRVLRLIGSGGMSVVYLAVDIALDRKIAIKTLPRLLQGHALRMQREARAMASVLHPNLAMIFAVETWRGSPLLIVEYLENGTLADRRTRFEPAEAIDLGIILADVLDRLHGSGVLHRDVKPSNIGYTREGVPKLMDFGVAQMLDRAGAAPELAACSSAQRHSIPHVISESPDVVSLTCADHVIGTPLYLSPEALEGAEPDPSFDLWSLSLVLFEIVAGQNPFHAQTIAEVLDKIRSTAIPDISGFCLDCPVAVAHFFKRALARDRAERPDSAAELRNQLRRLRVDLSSTS